MRGSEVTRGLAQARLLNRTKRKLGSGRLQCLMLGLLAAIWSAEKVKCRRSALPALS